MRREDRISFSTLDNNRKSRVNFCLREKNISNLRFNQIQRILDLIFNSVKEEGEYNNARGGHENNGDSKRISVLLRE